MQFFLDDSAAIPIQLFSVSNAPQRRHAEAPAAATVRGDRCVPGYPFIRFASDDDYDGSYPFDAFQDLRMAYGASPLTELQDQMRGLLQQRAQVHIRRTLLEQQLRAQKRREQELLEHQLRLQQQRQTHARRAAENARAAYLSRLQKEEAQRQLEIQRQAQQQHQQQQQQQQGPEDDSESKAFFPPFHFFNHILASQIRSQDDAERRRAVKAAMTNLLDSYFGTAAPKAPAQSTPPPAVAPPAPSPAALPQDVPRRSAKDNAPAARSLPPTAARDPYADPAELDSVLRVVQERLAEIAAKEDTEKAKQQAVPTPPAAVEQSTPPQDKVNMSVIEEPASTAQPARTSPPPRKAGFEVEEPVDYDRLAQALRSRVVGLDDSNIFLPPSPTLANADEEPAAPAPTREREQPAQPMDVDSGAQCSDSEFASLLDGCKSQLRDIQEASAKPRKRSARRRRSHQRRSSKRGADEAALDQGAKPTTLGLDEAILGPSEKERDAKVQRALEQLRHIERELDQVRHSYSQQVSDTQLSFVADKTGSLRLAYNHGNAAFREYQEVLQRLLLSLDAISSHGNEAIRAKRKEVVRKIQAILDALDQFAADQESEYSESTTGDLSSLTD